MASFTDERNRPSFHTFLPLLWSQELRRILDFRNDRVRALRGLRPNLPLSPEPGQTCPISPTLVEHPQLTAPAPPLGRTMPPVHRGGARLVPERALRFHRRG
jgi:hypothetical protein